MKIYKIKNDLGTQIYIIASNIDNAIEKFKEIMIGDESPVINEIQYIGLCVIGE